MPYKITQSIDHLDTNPLVTTFDEEWEALEFMHECINGVVQYRVDHSPYAITEEELNEMYEQERELIRIEPEGEEK